MAARRVTRSLTEDIIFGQHLETLPENQLPLKLEIIRFYLHKRETECDQVFTRKGKQVKSLKPATKLRIIKEITTQITQTWSERANIPTKSQRAIEQSVESVISEALDCHKAIGTYKKEKPNWNLDVIQKKGFDKILDIAKCHCFVRATSDQEINICKCGHMPEREIPFYREQKFVRRGLITASIDLNATAEIQKQHSRELKKQNEPDRLAKQRDRECATFDSATDADLSLLGAAALDPLDDIDGNATNDDDDSDFEIVDPTKPPTYNTNNYDLMISYAKRMDVSSNVLSGIISCLRVCEKEFDPSKFLSAGKINYQWKKYKEKITKKHAEICDVKCLKVDGKKGPSLQPHNKFKVIDKYTCTAEPGGFYLHHFELDPGTGENVAAGIYEILHAYSSTESLLAIGGDNCPTNTGTNDNFQ